MAEFDDSPDERLQHEAEELMRQKRYLDAAGRYQDLRSHHPTDLWASLGHCSALECAGRIQEAEQVLEEVTLRHKRSAAHLHTNMLEGKFAARKVCRHTEMKKPRFLHRGRISLMQVLPRT